MQKLLNWLDKYVLEVGVGLLLVFIPLYPKLPLLDVLQTWVISVWKILSLLPWLVPGWCK